MQRFAIVTNAYKDKELKLTKEIAAYITQKGGSAVSLCEEAGQIKDYEQIDFSGMPKDTECMLVLGGDGTLIRAATGTHELSIPLIGINMGTLGYLCEVQEEKAFSAIDRLISDTFMTEERMMLEGVVVRRNRELSNEDPDNSIKKKRRNEWIKYSALNDLVIHRSGDLSILRFNIYVNGEFLTTYDADGVIISTPTGTTGYNLSAGGPIVDPKAKMLVLTPINAHNLNSKSIVLAADDIIEVELGTRRYQKDETAGISCDGDICETLFVEDRLRVVRSANVVKICKLSNKSFLEILRNKMGSYT
uniref:NAD(+)/NADH kinase n=1 Tax=Agathobacter sp. TaxID=2021311 RepID=UPI0040559FF0